MSRPRALDLFCCAGGASMGLHRAGFDVVGVDIKPRKNYPFEVIKHDALALPESILSAFDFIWASPPCQGYSAMRHAPGAVGAERLIGATRERLQRIPTAFWVRHRLFEANFRIPAPECRHDDRPVIGVYGGHARKRSALAGGRGTQDVWEGGHRAAASEALGIDWMTLGEMSEAIPPLYAEHIGRAAMALIQAERIAA